MIIKEKNCIEIISALTMEDWQPLLDLIPQIEGVEQFGDSTEAMKLFDQGIMVMNPYVEHEVVLKFRNIIDSMPITIDFSWPTWEEGRDMAGDENFDFNTVDIITKCKVLTAFMRNDRFCAGALIGAFESGIILKILKSFRLQLNN